MNYDNYIGADPAFRKGGFSIAIIRNKEVVFLTFKNGFLDFQSWINRCSDVSVVCIENSNLQNLTFDNKGSKKVIARKSRNVGMNQAISQLSVDFCKTKSHLLTIEISPKQKGKKWTKTTALSVMQQDGLTTTKKNLTQDEIDALQIALKGKQLSRMRIKT